MSQKKAKKDASRKKREKEELAKLNKYYMKIIKKYGEFDKRTQPFKSKLPGEKYFQQFIKVEEAEESK